MEKFSFEDYLEKRYSDQMKYYSSASRKNQKQYKNLQWILIILSTFTTIAAALPETLHLKYVVVVSSGIVTIITAGLKTFKYEELWANYRSTLEKLKPQFYFYHLNIGRYGRKGANKEAIFVETVEEILSNEQSAWLSTKSASEQSSEKKLEELQAKLDGLLKEKFNTVKPITGHPVNELEPMDVPAENAEMVTTDTAVTEEQAADSPSADDAIGSAEMVDETGSENEENALGPTIDITEEPETSSEEPENLTYDKEEGTDEIPEEKPKKP